MINCAKCKKAVRDGEMRKHNSQILCEDCHIDALLSPVQKTYYESDTSEFMRRLQKSYSVHRQQYD